MEVIVIVGEQRIPVKGTLAKMIALMVARGKDWNLDDPAGTVSVHLRKGEGWIRARVEREEPPVRDGEAHSAPNKGDTSAPPRY